MAVSEVQISQLLQAATKAREAAYAPYSGFGVGAAIIVGSGAIFTGCNVENASYGLTICAERVAIFAAVAQEGEAMRIRALAVVNERSTPFPPCGACRQVILEFGPEAVVFFERDDGLKEMRADELLPEGFSLP